MVILLCGCDNQKKHMNEEKATDCQPYQISEKCVALLAYGLLSDDENDIPLGGACKGVLSDSVIMYLQVQKRIVNNWKYNKKLSDKLEMHLGRNFGDRDIDLLGHLIMLRHEVRWRGDNEWLKRVGNIPHYYGKEYSFYWRLIAHGITNNTTSRHQSFFNLDTLNEFENFRDYFVYIDSLLVGEPKSIGKPIALSSWCGKITKLVDGLREYSKDDFLLRYYDIRCKDENLLDIIE